MSKAVPLLLKGLTLTTTLILPPPAEAMLAQQDSASQRGHCAFLSSQRDDAGKLRSERRFSAMQ